jgi:hypothetical protein
MKSFVNALLFCFVVFMLTSCKKDNPVDSSPSVKQIWPLKPGNTWAFSTIEYDTTGAVTQSGSGAFVVTTDTIVGGETWYHISSSGTTFYTNRSDGFWVMSNSTFGLFQGLLFKYPVSAGDSWNCGGDQIFLQSADTLITVPAGTFHCYEYRLLYNSEPMSDYYYYCPGVGIIAEDSYSSTNSGRLYIEGRLSITSVTLK